MMGSFSSVVLLFQMCWILSPTLGSNPVMTHTSMDVGNIISIIIPESPDTNINIDQLTADFKRQLERIRKQSRVNKLEHGLVTLKNVLPEMSKEEKKKTLPLIRRVLQTRRVMPPKNSTKESSQQRKTNQKSKPTRRSPQTKASNTKAKKPTKKPGSQKPETRRSNVNQMTKQRQKVKKNPKVMDLENAEDVNENGYDKEYFFIKDYREAKWPDSQRRVTEMNQADRHDDAVDFDRNERPWERADINRPNRRAPAQFPCSETKEDDGHKVRSPKGIRSDGFKNNIIKTDEAKGIVSYPMDAGDVIDYDEMKGYERILQSSSVTQLPQVFNSSEENTLIKRKTDEPGRSEFNDEISVVKIPFSGSLDAIPRMGQFVNVDDENIEIRVQRSVDDNFLGRRTTRRPHYRPHSTKRRAKEGKTKRSMMRKKKPRKNYPKVGNKMKVGKKNG